MARPTPSGPVSIPALLILECAVGKGLILVSSSSSPGRSPGWHFMRTPTPDDKRPGRTAGEGIPEIEHVTAQSLLERLMLDTGSRDAIDRSLGIKPGQVASARDPEAWANRSPLAWYERPHSVNDAGRRALEEGRGRIAEWRRAEAARAALPPEFVALRRARQPGVGALCRVVSRTPKRVYVEVVDTGGVTGASALLEGVSGKFYVAAEHVAVDCVDPADWKRLSEATLDRDARVRRDAGRYEERINAIREEQRAAMAQADGEYEDMVREVLGSAGPRP